MVYDLERMKCAKRSSCGDQTIVYNPLAIVYYEITVEMRVHITAYVCIDLHISNV